MMTKKNYFRVTLLALVFAPNLNAWWGNNCSLPHDIFQRQNSPIREIIDWDKTDKTYHLNSGTTLSLAFNGKGRDKDGKTVGLYQIYSPKDRAENAVERYGAYQEGVATVSPGLDWESRFAGGGFTNSDLGDLSIEATRNEICANLWASAAIPLKQINGSARLSAFLPIKSIATSNIAVNSINVAPGVPTDIISEQGIINELLTTAALGTQKPVNENVFGDLYIMLGWHNVFEQSNDMVEKVGLMGQIGVSIPLQKTKTYENIFAVSNGSDGAVGLPISANVDVYLKNNFRLFGAADVHYFFHDTNKRRLKTSRNQGELVLPVVSEDVQRKLGTLLRLTGSMEIMSTTKIFWGGLGYQYGKKMSDKITVNDNQHLSDLVNESERFQEAIFHNTFVYLGMDLSKYVERFAPALNISLQYPLKGQRIALFNNVAAELSIKF